MSTPSVNIQANTQPTYLDMGWIYACFFFVVVVVVVVVFYPTIQESYSVFMELGGTFERKKVGRMKDRRGRIRKSWGGGRGGV